MTTEQDAKMSGHEVRLFPSAHIKSDREAELRATASLLVVIRAVAEFGKTTVRIAGGPAGKLSCYTEVTHQLRENDASPPVELRPDGVVQTIRGKTKWTALVEVKVGNAVLDPDQVDSYHRLARQECANAVITVSNQSALPNGQPPVNLDGRRSRAIPVTHFSWERLLSEAQLLSRKKKVSDPDQKWILDEWIRYVEDPNSRIIVPPDLGAHWADVLRAARTGALDQSSNELREVAKCWMGYLRKVSMRLRAKLGVDVEMRLTRKEKRDNTLHLEHLVTTARTNGTLTGRLRIPDAVGDIQIDLFLHSRSVRYRAEVAAPTEGRQMTRINWMSRQLRGLDLPSDLVVAAVWTNRGSVTSAPASQFVDDPGVLLTDKQGISVPKDATPKSYQIQWTNKLHASRGRSSAPVLEGISKGLEEFYRRVVEHLVPFVPSAPRLVSKDALPRDRDTACQDSRAEPVPEDASPTEGTGSATSLSLDASRMAHGAEEPST